MALVVAPIPRYSPVMPDKILDAKGKVTQPWEPDDLFRTPAWGTPEIWIDGADRTTWRDVRTIPERWSFVKPHWYGDATIFLPQLTTHEPLPDWCAEGKSLDILRRLPGGTLSTDVRDPWRGYITKITDRDGGTELTCDGLYQQPALYRRAPGLRDEPIEVGTLVPFNLQNSTRPAYRWPGDPAPIVTGAESNYRANWENVLEYLAAIGAVLPGYTFRPGADFTPQYVDVLTDPGETWTFSYADGHLEAELGREMMGSPRVIYAEGVVNGVEWRRMVLQSTGDPIFIPLSADPVVNTFWMDADGNLLIDDTDFDPSVLRYEVFWKLPPGMTEDDAAIFADLWRMRVADPGWAGTATANVCPQEGHLLEMRPDDVAHVRGYRGHDTDLHIAEVSFDWNDGTPKASLTLDENARDLATLNLLLGLDGNPPDFERATNPFAQVQVGKDSGVRKDRTVQWDYNGGSGWVPNDETNGRRHRDGVSTIDVATGWTRYGFLAAEDGTIAFSEIVVSGTGDIGVGEDPRRFVAMVADRYLVLPGEGPTPSALPGDPLDDGAWEDDVLDDLIRSARCEAWGGSFRDPQSGTYVVNAAGYGNIAARWESQGDPVTGQMRDETPFPFTHGNVPDGESEPSKLYLYVYNPGAAAKCWARFAKGPSST